MMPQLLAHLFGDYILQSEWMAQNKTKRSWPAFVHALLYSLCFVPLCWVTAHVTVHQPPCITYVDARGGETPCVTEGLQVPANAHGYNVYAVRPSVDVLHHAHFRWLPWLVIFATHFLIDRFRLARYVVWAKNWLAPWSPLLWEQRMSWKICSAQGFVPEGRNGPPAYLSTWLLIIVDNTLHLCLNYFEVPADSLSPSEAV